MFALCVRLWLRFIACVIPHCRAVSRGRLSRVLLMKPAHFDVKDLARIPASPHDAFLFCFLCFVRLRDAHCRAVSRGRLSRVLLMGPAHFDVKEVARILVSPHVA